MPQPELETDQFLSRKRSRKSERQRLKLKKYASRNRGWRRDRNTWFGTRSQIIGMLAQHATQSIKTKKYEVHVKIKKRFSFIDDPIGTIKLLTSFAKALQDGPKIRKIVFHHQDLEEYDLAANALLDLIAVERKTELRNRGSRKGLKVAGYYPVNPSVKRFIKSMGIIKHMEITHEAPTESEAEKLRIFDARNRHYLRNPDGAKADFKDREQSKFVDHIDNCLKDNGWELSDIGKQMLVVYTGEILTNAEEHAGFVDWTVQGYLDNSLEIPICEIAIFNFGKSIAQSLKELDRSSYTWDQIGQYVELHAKKGFFGLGWQEDDLLTVVALQANVSRLNRSVTDTRGQGTVDLISFFQEIHRSCTNGGTQAKMAILSGSTHILFDGKYKLLDRPEAGKIIAFNEANDLSEKPDAEYVKSLSGVYFPGTIISVKFPLSLAFGAMVEEIQNGNDGNRL